MSFISHDLMKFAFFLHSWSSPGLPIPLSMSGWTLKIDLAVNTTQNPTTIDHLGLYFVDFFSSSALYLALSNFSRCLFRSLWAGTR